MTWTSGKLTLEKGRVKAEIKQEILEKVQESLVSFGTSNVLKLKDLEEFIGRCECIASLIFVLRLCIAMLREPLYSTEPQNGPTN